MEWCWWLNHVSVVFQKACPGMFTCSCKSPRKQTGALIQNCCDNCQPKANQRQRLSSPCGELNSWFDRTTQSEKWRCYSISRVQLFVTPWSVAQQAPLSMEFSRQEYWSGLPCPSPRDLLHPEIKPESPALHADSLPTQPPEKSWMTTAKLPPKCCWYRGAFLSSYLTAQYYIRHTGYLAYIVANFYKDPVN